MFKSRMFLEGSLGNFCTQKDRLWRLKERKKERKQNRKKKRASLQSSTFYRKCPGLTFPLQVLLALQLLARCLEFRTGLNLGTSLSLQLKWDRWKIVLCTNYHRLKQAVPWMISLYTWLYSYLVKTIWTKRRLVPRLKYWSYLHRYSCFLPTNGTV